MSTSTARHHTEWLSLLEISGPFLSLPVLLRVFPQGVHTYDSSLTHSLRTVYEEWLDNQQGLHPNPAIHRAWVMWVLAQVLEMPPSVMREEPSNPRWRVTVAEYDETLTPDLVIVEPAMPFGPPPSGDEAARLLVTIVPPGQDLDRPLAGASWKASPATRMMTLLHAAGVRLGLVTNGERWMLVNARPGEATGFVSWFSELWLDEPLTLRAFRTLLGAARFFAAPADETMEALLDASGENQQEVTDQLGQQVRHAVELLVQALDRADQDAGRTLLTGVSEVALYETAVTVMMRLVFLLTAEERRLLPLDDPLYQRHYAASTLAEQLREDADQAGEDVLERRHDAWPRLLALFRSVHGGINHDRLRLPAYGGSLFDPARFPFLEGRSSRKGAKTQSREEKLSGSASLREPSSSSGLDESQSAIRNPQSATPLLINNRVILHLLEALQFLQVEVPGGERQRRRLSFRALDIEQIGYVYEGLLDHTAVRAVDPVLGLTGTRNQEPEIPLPVLEQFLTKDGGRQTNVEHLPSIGDEKALLAFLREQTGRSENALRNALHAAPPDLWRVERLRAACNNDDLLFRRVLPWQGLIRDDDYARPVVIPAGSVYVTTGVDRRASGAHYTPRSLTEPIVQHTLEPLVYDGPAQGKERAEWRLRRPEAILALKICDKTMGSAAFLVQTCRYLSERLVEALEEGKRQSAKGKSGRSDSSDSAQSVSNALSLLRAAESDEERLTLARRLVADRCLYGVDKNPLAVEMAKLSLWLITMDRGKPFTFLDHALKCGDSLVGVDLAQLSHWNLHPDQSAELFTIGLQLDIEQLVSLRRQIEEMPVLDVRDQEAKAYQLAQADALAHEIKGNADLLIASYYNDLSKREQETLRASLLLVARDGASIEEKWRQHADLGNLQPFHWPLEFPEVFLSEGRSGFDAFVGNPPFIGGKRVRDTLGDNYRTYLNAAYPESTGNTDYCALFFLRGFQNASNNGVLGLIATNTIAQGDTRRGGLEIIERAGGTIYHAVNNLRWPGLAAVVVSIVHISKGVVQPPFSLDNNIVPHISSLLESQIPLGSPHTLVENEGKSHIGSYIHGLGFVLGIDEALHLLVKDQANKDVLFPYIIGEDLNSHPEQQPSRWIINFYDWPRERTQSGSWINADEEVRRDWLKAGVVPKDYPGRVAADYPECYQIVYERVFPERQTKEGAYARLWWQYGRRQERLYQAIASLQRVLAVTVVSRTVAFDFVPSTWVYAHRLCVFAYDDHVHFAVLQSSFHYAWAWRYSSTLKQDLNYSPTDVFQTFPFPQSPVPNLQSLGEAYHDHRAAIMLTRQEGLTATYNRFHDPGESAADIMRLRELHVEMDNAVAVSYGWGDLVLGHGFHETAQGVRYTISESARREVLARLLVLNHERYAEEVREGLHEKKAKGKAQKAKRGGVDDAQLGLF